MTEKNPCFTEWLEKYRRLMDESIAGIRRIKIKPRRVKDKGKVKWYSVPTWKIRRDVVRGLGDL